MYLVQLLLPLYDNANQAIAQARFQSVRRELTERFGGATAYTRAPAEGTWRGDDGRIRHDAMVVVEVMTDSLERDWWANYRVGQCERFRQKAIVV